MGFPRGSSPEGGGFLEVTVAAPEGVAAELASDALFAAGATGIEERPALADGRAVLVAYLPPARLPLDAAPLAALGAAVTSARRVAEEDWEAAFWAGLAPLELGRRLVVVSSRARRDELPPGRTPVRLDPGSAFGTGLHASTALAAALLDDALAVRGRASLLDVGTGSGILAIAGYLLGARPVLAIDNDAEAVEEAWANARRNGCREAFEASDLPLESIVARFDVAIANLDAPALARLGASVAERVAENGELIISGLREGESLPEPAGFTRLEIRTAGGWRAERWRRL